MKSQAKLRAVPDVPVEQSPPDTSYEGAQRRHILSRDWAKVHSDADRRKPFATVMGRFA